MTLLVIFVLMCICALLILFIPFIKSDQNQEDEQVTSLSVYSDQLARIETDVENRLLSPQEAEAARVEISRRAIAAAQDNPSGASIINPTLKKSALAVTALALVGIPLAGYVIKGSPYLPGQSFASRAEQPLESLRVDEIVAQAEFRLRENPDSLRGWEALLPFYMNMGRYSDAAEAFRNIIRISGDNAPAYAGLGEAISRANGGVITAEAREALEKSVEIDPKLMRSRFLLAIAKEQEKDYPAAAASWEAIVNDAEVEEQWRSVAQDRLAKARSKLGIAEDPSTADNQDVDQPGPTQEDIEAAQELSDSERRAFVDAMVERLADKLKEDGNDLNGWLRLARSYRVLNKVEEAKTALKNAEETFAGNEDALSQINKLRSQLGL